MSASSLPRDPVRAAHVRHLAWPVLVSMLSMSAMNVADTLFVGWLGTAELAAVGLATTLTWFVFTPSRGLLKGIKILTSQRTGAEDVETSDQLVTQGLWMAVVMGVLLLMLAPLGAQLFWALGASSAVSDHATSYFAIRVLFAPIVLSAWATELWFQGRGDTRTPMVASVIGNVLNIALDPLLIFGLGPVPALGIAGAAWATVISQIVGGAILLWRAWPTIRRSLAPSWSLIRRSLPLGVPIAAQWTLDFGGFLVFLSLLARAGDAHLAAHVLVFRIVQVSMLPGFAIGDAAGVLVGQAVGARRSEAARQAWAAGVWQSIVLMGAFGVLFLVAPTWVLAPFDPSADVATLGITLLALAALWQVADALVMVNYCALSSAGDTRFTLLLFVGGSWFIQVPLTLLLVGWLEWGAVGAWWALTIEITLMAAASQLRIRSRGWLEGRMARESAAEVDDPVPDGGLATA